jgi:hypothetical protein
VTIEERGEMSQAAVRAIAEADVRYDRVLHYWMRTVLVEYREVELGDGPVWRPAREGETCIAGAGGKGAWRSKACGAPAVVTQESVRGTKPYRAGRCGLHAGGRLPLEDGRVIEPVNNPLGGA